MTGRPLWSAECIGPHGVVVARIAFSTPEHPRHLSTCERLAAWPMRRMTRPDRPIRACRQQAFGQFGYLTVPLHADLAIKEKALARTTPATTQPDQYHPPDQLLAFFGSPLIMPTFQPPVRPLPAAPPARSA